MSFFVSKTSENGGKNSGHASILTEKLDSCLNFRRRFSLISNVAKVGVAAAWHVHCSMPPRENNGGPSGNNPQLRNSGWPTGLSSESGSHLRRVPLARERLGGLGPRGSAVSIVDDDDFGSSELAGHVAKRTSSVPNELAVRRVDLGSDELDDRPGTSGNASCALDDHPKWVELAHDACFRHEFL